MAIKGVHNFRINVAVGKNPHGRGFVACASIPGRHTAIASGTRHGIMQCATGRVPKLAVRKAVGKLMKARTHAVRSSAFKGLRRKRRK